MTPPQPFYSRSATPTNGSSRHSLAGKPFAKIVDDHIMEPRALLHLIAACSALPVNSVKHFDHLDHAHRKTCLFQQFAPHAFLQRFAQFPRPARDTPTSPHHPAPPPHYQRPP